MITKSIFVSFRNCLPTSLATTASKQGKIYIGNFETLPPMMAILMNTNPKSVLVYSHSAHYDQTLSSTSRPTTTTNFFYSVAAMFIASKYKEMFAPEIGDFMHITDRAYTEFQIRNGNQNLRHSLLFTKKLK